jgi:hypothetical protein
MRTATTMLMSFMLILGSIQISYSGIRPGNLYNNKKAILTLNSTESIDFRVETIESDGFVLDTITTIKRNHIHFLPDISNGGKLLFTPNSFFANVTAGAIDIELLAYNGGVATVNLNAGNSIEFHPASFTITSSTTNKEAVLFFIDEAKFSVQPGERKQIVSIDIARPDPAQRISTSKQGIIPVVIYGSANLDVSSIDVGSLLLIGRDMKIDRILKNMAKINHINNDGYPDLVVKFSDIDSGFFKDLSYATIMGNLADGTTISGKAYIRVAQ